MDKIFKRCEILNLSMKIKRRLIRFCLIGSVIQFICFMILSWDVQKATRYPARYWNVSSPRSSEDPEVERLFLPGREITERDGKIVKICKMTYHPETDILRMKKPDLIPRFKNPCWISKGQFLCLPYFYLVGVAKCGTTDLFEKIALHPEFRRPSIKEPLWLSTRRLMPGKNSSIEFYATTFFGEAAKQIQASGQDGRRSSFITGEASVNTINGFIYWELMPENQGMDYPVVSNPEYIYHLNPNSRILINVRNPVDRLWSEYLAFTQDKEPSAQKFHNLIMRAITLYIKCLRYRTLRSCMYNKRLADYSTMSDEEREKGTSLVCGRRPKDIILIRRGVYHVFIKDYLKVFPRDQILIQRLEDMAENQVESLSKTFEFLGLGPLDGELKDAIETDRIRNTRKSDRQKGDMYMKTRQILKNFYTTHNKELAKLLDDRRFLYEE